MSKQSPPPKMNPQYLLSIDEDPCITKMDLCTLSSRYGLAPDLSLQKVDKSIRLLQRFAKFRLQARLGFRRVLMQFIRDIRMIQRAFRRYIWKRNFLLEKCLTSWLKHLNVITKEEIVRRYKKSVAYMQQACVNQLRVQSNRDVSGLTSSLESEFDRRSYDQNIMMEVLMQLYLEAKKEFVHTYRTEKAKCLVLATTNEFAYTESFRAIPKVMPTISVLEKELSQRTNFAFQFDFGEAQFRYDAVKYSDYVKGTAPKKQKEEKEAEEDQGTAGLSPLANLLEDESSDDDEVEERRGPEELFTSQNSIAPDIFVSQTTIASSDTGGPFSSGFVAFADDAPPESSNSMDLSTPQQIEKENRQRRKNRTKKINYDNMPDVGPKRGEKMLWTNHITRYYKTRRSRMKCAVNRVKRMSVSDDLGGSTSMQGGRRRSSITPNSSPAERRRSLTKSPYEDALEGRRRTSLTPQLDDMPPRRRQSLTPQNPPLSPYSISSSTQHRFSQSRSPAVTPRREVSSPQTPQPLSPFKLDPNSLIGSPKRHVTFSPVRNAPLTDISVSIPSMQLKNNENDTNSEEEEEETEEVFVVEKPTETIQTSTMKTNVKRRGKELIATTVKKDRVTTVVRAVGTRVPSSILKQVDQKRKKEEAAANEKLQVENSSSGSRKLSKRLSSLAEHKKSLQRTPSICLFSSHTAQYAKRHATIYQRPVLAGQKSLVRAQSPARSLLVSRRSRENSPERLLTQHEDRSPLMYQRTKNPQTHLSIQTMEMDRTVPTLAPPPPFAANLSLSLSQNTSDDDGEKRKKKRLQRPSTAPPTHPLQEVLQGSAAAALRTKVATVRAEKLELQQERSRQELRPASASPSHVLESSPDRALKPHVRPASAFFNTPAKVHQRLEKQAMAKFSSTHTDVHKVALHVQHRAVNLWSDEALARREMMLEAINYASPQSTNNDSSLLLSPEQTASLSAPKDFTCMEEEEPRFRFLRKGGKLSASRRKFYAQKQKNDFSQLLAASNMGRAISPFGTRSSIHSAPISDYTKISKQTLGEETSHLLGYINQMIVAKLRSE